jgi:hypothetical protein
MKQW